MPCGTFSLAYSLINFVLLRYCFRADATVYSTERLLEKANRPLFNGMECTLRIYLLALVPKGSLPFS